MNYQVHNTFRFPLFFSTHLGPTDVFFAKVFKRPDELIFSLFQLVTEK